MLQKGSGILLYMLQEGRNIGLVNKIRAYEHKHKGLDTVDANIVLGFDDDQRSFKEVSEILNTLGIKEIELLSNNPKKSNSLETYGIQVIRQTPLTAKANAYNKAYIATKQKKLNHQIEKKSTN